MKKIIHVNQHIIKSNKKNQKIDPVFTVKQGKANDKANQVVILGPSTVVYKPHKPLKCGATAWIETNSDVQITKEIKESVYSTPSISVNWFFVPYGYQIDIYQDGKLAYSECRDFGGNYLPKKLKQEIMARTLKLMDEFRGNK